MILFNFETLCFDIFVPPYIAWFTMKFLVCNLSHDCHICVDRNTTAVNKLQVAIKGCVPVP